MRPAILVLLVAGLLFTVAFGAAIQTTGKLVVTLTPDQYTLERGGTVHLTVTVTRNNEPFKEATVVEFFRELPDSSTVSIIPRQSMPPGGMTVAVPTADFPAGPVTFVATVQYYPQVTAKAVYNPLFSGSGSTTLTLEEPPITTVTTITTVIPTTTVTPAKTVSPTKTRIPTTVPVPVPTIPACTFWGLSCEWVTLISAGLVVIVITWVLYAVTRPPLKPPSVYLDARGGIDLKGRSPPEGAGFRLEAVGGIEKREKKDGGGR